jgi:hypothetical protein
VVALNVLGTFTVKVNNSINIGKTTDEIVHIWNTDHSDNIIFGSEEERETYLA